MNWLRFGLVFTLLVGVSIGPTSAQSDRESLTNRLELRTEKTESGKISRGHFRVFENREAGKGRELKLDIVVLHASGDSPKADPVFYLAGGPGQAAATLWRGLQNSWIRRNRDIVLVNQRGTGGTNRIQLPPFKEAVSAQAYLRPLMEPERVKQAAKVLGEQFDLRMYSTPMAMDDLNEIRQALGYDRINLIGGSYGTRAALVYIRRHGKTVRTATLNGVAPIEFKNPLYHAQEAQAALDRIFDEIEGNDTYRKAFPDLRNKFAEILKRLEQNPVEVELTDRQSGAK